MFIIILICNYNFMGIYVKKKCSDSDDHGYSHNHDDSDD